MPPPDDSDAPRGPPPRRAPAKAAAEDQREARLAQALRANLRRRKAAPKAPD